LFGITSMIHQDCNRGAHAGRLSRAFAGFR
jgi:hypothetical protein